MTLLCTLLGLLLGTKTLQKYILTHSMKPFKIKKKFNIGRLKRCNITHFDKVLIDFVHKCLLNERNK
jgi:hypothetical protein